MMNEVDLVYPLQWVPSQPRTKMPQIARFGEKSVAYASGHLVEELQRLGAKKCRVSSNLQTRIKGDSYLANQRLSDAGVVVYFELKGKQKAMACDKWTKVEQNMWALYLSVAAIRGLDRWGGSEFLDGLFTGFSALPSPDQITVPLKYYFDGFNSKDSARAQYLDYAKKLHPDNGGDKEQFQEMKRQYEMLK